jgi:hypothetical protein
MLELQDAAGRLVVVMPLRLRHEGRIFCVFREGKLVADFRDPGEAARFARALAGGEACERLRPGR